MFQWLITFLGYSVVFIKNFPVIKKISLIFFVAGWIFLLFLSLYYINFGANFKRKPRLKNKKLVGVFVDFLPFEQKHLTLFMGLSIFLVFAGVFFQLTDFFH